MKPLNQFISFQKGDLLYRFLPTGDVFYFGTEGLMLNQFRASRLDGSANQIYLRLYDRNGSRCFPLLGIRSGSRLLANDSMLSFQGVADSVRYRVDFLPADSCWLWRVTLEGDAETDLLYGQDLGVGSRWSVPNNPLYNSQYIGHSVFDGEFGYRIATRQNSPIDGRFPFTQLGVLGKRAVHYATDGLQFFGLQMKETGVPQACAGDLPDQVLQYECAYAALQTQRFSCAGGTCIGLYGLYLPDHPEAVTHSADETAVREMFAAPSPDDGLRQVSVQEVRSDLGPMYSSPVFSEEQIDALYPHRRLVEYVDGRTGSFFTPDHAHVVTKTKELQTLRPHGSIVMSLPDTHRVDPDVIASTQFFGGVFNSHVAVGNTDMNQMLSDTKGFLNLQKNAGQRIYIRLGGSYRLLNNPALFEMGLNYSRWIYALEDDVLEITSFAATEKKDVVLDVKSQKGRKYDFIAAHQFIMGAEDFEACAETERIDKGIRVFHNSQAYPRAYYDLVVADGQYLLSDDRIFFRDLAPFDDEILTLTLPDRSAFRIVIHAHLEGENTEADTALSFEKEKAEGLAYYQELIGGLTLSGGLRAQILNETALWYAENAMVHFISPHGLEQCGGAAWGTRDVCQGPVEFFLATGHFDLVADILRNVFAHQSLNSGEWPQWFMFDRYKWAADECHGDVIFWPLKALANYISVTGDTGILTETVPYSDAEERQTLLRHLDRALHNLYDTRFIGNTGLISYAGGDWDDTLQPADPKMKETLVSGWTQALAYETFTALSRVLTDRRLADAFADAARRVGSAWQTRLVKDGVPVGFLSLEDGERYLLHPLDDATGIHYRLLPLTRSIISELAGKDQARINDRLIHEHLEFPDGVRLMDRPAAYCGGVSRLFRRAEQAAHVGREIGLQYTHAHIRYMEAMAKLGRADKAWEGLFRVNPILIRSTVANAALRQSNTYFSSSDGAFADRYDYARRFDLLREGKIPVRAGWRLYSSGPGIYLRQLICNVLGIRMAARGLILDPVLPEEAGQMECFFRCFGKQLHLRYHISGEPLRVLCRGKPVAAEHVPGAYRDGGVLIRRDTLLACSGELDVFL